MTVSPSPDDPQVDLLVLGAGMAGLAAAAEAAAAGAVVGVAEKLPEIGGSAALSAGIFWAPRDEAELRARIPGGEPELGRALTADFPGAAEWVRGTGIEMSDRIEGPYFGFGVGWQIDVRGFFDWCRRQVEARGGWVVRETAGRKLLARPDGRVHGAVLAGPDGPVTVEAGAVLLATGGFQGDPALVASFIGRHADRVLVRSNPGSVGDGFRLAGSVGGAASRSLGGFYGHLVGSPVKDWSERHFLPLTQYHSIYCILVDLNGRRFIDESRGDEYANQAVVALPGSRAVLLADDATRRARVVTAPYPRGEVVDRFQAAADAGARYAIADSVDELIAAVAAWGIPAGTLRATLADYDVAAAGQPVLLDAPVPASPAPLRVPPFHALEVQPALTFPLGGIRIDADGRVLDRDDHPIPGLFAAGADAGGLYHEGYGGGLGMSCVFGRRAARAALGEHRIGGAGESTVTGQPAGSRP
jgi:succinate dehydrogenase/fumarate reductase flavoprotein subunit